MQRRATSVAEFHSQTLLPEPSLMNIHICFFESRLIHWEFQMCKKVFPLLTISLIVLLNSNSLAQSQSGYLEEVVITSSRIPMPIRQIGTSVSIIDEQDIQAHGNVSIIDILRQSTGVGVSRNGGTGSLSSLRIRGEEGFRTLTIFDGLKLADPSAHSRRRAQSPGTARSRRSAHWRQQHPPSPAHHRVDATTPRCDG